MNGEAIYKRYEVKDLATGEVLDEPLYVLRPRKDHVAVSAMFAYAAMCNLNNHNAGSGGGEIVSRLVAQPFKNFDGWQEAIDDYVVPLMDPPTHTNSGIDLLRLSNMGPDPDGTVEYAYLLLESLGLEVATTVFRPIPEERQKAAKRRLTDRENAAIDAAREEVKA